MISGAIKRLNYKFYPGTIFFPPDWIVLGVNNVCNLHCKMCDVGLKNSETNFAINLTGTHPMNMPLPLIRNIIDQTSTFFPSAKIGYAFTEPLIYPHLIESLDYAKNKNIYTTITTNAMNLKTVAAELCNVGLKELFISLDGPQEIHNAIRGHKSSFQRAVAGIEAVLNFGDRPEVSVFCVITEWNIGHLKELADFFTSFRIKHLGFMHTNFTTADTAVKHNQRFGENYSATYSNTAEIDISKINFEILQEEITALKSADYPFKISFSPELVTLKELDVFYNHPDVFIGKGCKDVFRNMMIKSDGTVIPAHGRCYNLTIGNIYNKSLKDIWNSSIIAKFRKTLIQNGGYLPACSRCCSAFN